MKLLYFFSLIVVLLVAGSGLSAQGHALIFSDDFEASLALTSGEDQTVNRDPAGWTVSESTNYAVQVYQSSSTSGLNSPAGQTGTSGNYLRLRRDFGDIIEPAATREVDPDETANAQVRFHFRCWVVSSAATERGLRIFARGNSGNLVFDIELRVDGSIFVRENGVLVQLAGSNFFSRNAWVNGSVEVNLAGTGYTLNVGGSRFERPNRATNGIDRISRVGAGALETTTAGSSYAFVDDLSLTKTVLPVTNTNASGAGSLRQSLADAPEGTTIIFDNSLDGQTIALNGFQLGISKSINIDASSLANRLTIDAGGNSRVIKISGGLTVILRNLVITGGQAPNPSESGGVDGGGIHKLQGTLVLEQCLLSGNRAANGENFDPRGGDGGAIYSFGGDLILRDCEISDNRAGNAGDSGSAPPEIAPGAGRGGGIFYQKGSSGGGTQVTLTRCRILRNSSGSGGLSWGRSSGGAGGGLYIEGDTALLEGCTIADNATGQGGDVWPSLEPEGSEDPLAEAYGGHGGAGGGVYFRPVLNRTGLSVIACSVTGNRTGRGGDGNGITNCGGGSGGSGGGIAFESTPVGADFIISFSTVAGNATGRGGNGSRSSLYGLDDVAQAGNGGDGGGIFFAGEGVANLKLELSTVASNATGPAGAAGTMIGEGFGGSGGGLYNAFGESTTANASILALNSAAGNGPDSEGGYRVLSHSLVTVPDEEAVDESALVLVGHPRLAPLGDYGGATLSMPPLPGSPAIDVFPATDPISGVLDQRRAEPPHLARSPVDGDGDGAGGFDLGATEFDPSTDLNLYWPLDFDGDGMPFGVEHALGTDPLVSDRSDSRNLRLAMSGADPQITFGRNPDALGVGAWILERSPDPALESWEQIFHFDGDFWWAIGAISVVLGPDLITIIEEAPPPPAVFYRFVPLTAGRH